MDSVQGHLFSKATLNEEKATIPEVNLSVDFLKTWQEKIQSHQRNLFKGGIKQSSQVPLFPSRVDSEEHEINLIVDNLMPLKLTPLALSFWRWPTSHHKGPAVYLVMDYPEDLDTPILLYIGETVSADKRWRGEHDCKRYLEEYAEALSKNQITSKLSIRFLTDVPSSTKARRKLEQTLIEKWLPPFNKETRSRWVTPFTT